jgi:addiction module RelB/DinJ family antitoxin
MTRAKTKTNPGHPDLEVVKKAEAVFAEMGMTAEDAIAVFYKQAALRGSFPITELIPNEETQEAVSKARAGSDVVSYGSVDEVMAEFEDARANSDNEI